MNCAAVMSLAHVRGPLDIPFGYNGAAGIVRQGLKGPDSMKLHQLRYLAAVAQSGLNITAAAQKLHTSQPGVSKQIKLLEDELGFQIFTREGRNLTRITPAGQQRSEER